jgi:hypothetical protein
VGNAECEIRNRRGTRWRRRSFPILSTSSSKQDKRVFHNVKFDVYFCEIKLKAELQDLRLLERSPKAIDPGIERQYEQQPNEGDNYPLSYDPFAAVTDRPNQMK